MAEGTMVKRNLLMQKIFWNSSRKSLAKNKGGKNVTMTYFRLRWAAKYSKASEKLNNATQLSKKYRRTTRISISFWSKLSVYKVTAFQNCQRTLVRDVIFFKNLVDLVSCMKICLCTLYKIVNLTCLFFKFKEGKDPRQCCFCVTSKPVAK